MVGACVLAAQAAGDDLPVVVREMREAAEPGYVACAVNADVGLQRLRINLKPAAFGTRQARVAPRRLHPGGGVVVADDLMAAVRLDERSELLRHALRIERRMTATDGVNDDTLDDDDGAFQVAVSR